MKCCSGVGVVRVMLITKTLLHGNRSVRTYKNKKIRDICLGGPKELKNRHATNLVAKCMR
jgi:hypothetical protein